MNFICIRFTILLILMSPMGRTIFLFLPHRARIQLHLVLHVFVYKPLPSSVVLAESECYLKRPFIRDPCSSAQFCTSMSIPKVSLPRKRIITTSITHMVQGSIGLEFASIYYSLLEDFLRYSHWDSHVFLIHRICDCVYRQLW